MASQAFLNTFLNSPVIRTYRDEFYLILKQIDSGVKTFRKTRAGERYRAQRYLKEAKGMEIECLNPEDYYFLERILPNQAGITDLQNAAKVTSILCKQADKGLKEWGLECGFNVDTANLQKIAETHSRYYSWHFALRYAVDSLSTMRSRGEGRTSRVRVGSSVIVIDQDLALIVNQQARVAFLLSYDQLLMFKDMYHARFNTLLAASIIYPDSVLPGVIERVYDWFFTCIYRHGNKGYEIGKEVESLARSYLIELADPILGTNFSHSRMLEVVREKERKFGTTEEFLADDLDLILHSCNDLAQAVELFGLQKLSGHPLVDPKVGGLAVRDEARQHRFTGHHDALQLRYNFCRLYCEGYVRRRREWPGLYFSDKAKTTRLFQLYALNETNLSSTSYPLSDWDGVEFLKHHEFNYFENFLDLMDDKSLSYYRSNIQATWDRSVRPTSHKRLLLEMLNKPEISIRDIVDRVRLGDIPFDWMVVSLYPKEREFKVAARMFGMMVFEMRAFFTCTEANLADNIFPFMPQQTMTLSKLEIQDLFHEVTGPADQENYTRLFWEFDINKWNLHWEAKIVDYIGYDLNAMHGLGGVFTVIHHFFEQCAMLVRTIECRPDNVELAATIANLGPEYESSLLWFNHQVGIEGLFQKGWTLCTYPMIDLGVKDFGFPYYILGQGDNQIVLMLIECTGVPDRAEYIRELTDRILESVQSACMKVGQSIKANESLCSTTNITYSKNVYIEGVEYFTSCKAFSRMFPHSSSDFPSIDASLGSLSGQATMAAESLKNPLNGYVLWAFHSALYLHSLATSRPVEASGVPKGGLALSTPLIHALLLLPKSLGGLQIAPLTDFLYKGGADPVSKEYASLLFFQSSSPTVRRLIYSLQDGAWFQTVPKPEQLIDDPYSLPLQKVTTPEMTVYEQSSRRVRTAAANREIKEVMDLRIGEYSNQLVKSLMSVSPFNPLIVSDILGWSVVGVSRTIGKMFTATRTIQSLLQGSEDFNPCARILTSGAAVFNQTVNRLDTLPRLESKIRSIYREVQLMRNRWTIGNDLNIVGVTAYTPFEVPIQMSSAPISTQGVRAALLDTTGTAVNYTRGPHSPYLGTVTQERRSEHGYRIVTSSGPPIAIKRLADILTQPGIDVTTQALISSVAMTRGGIDLVAAKPYLSTRYGGTISHRYGTRLGVRSAHGLGAVAAASNAVLTTNCASPVSGGENDYPRMVQEDMICAIACLQISAHSSDLRTYIVIPYELANMIPLPDETMFCDIQSIPSPETLHSNSLVYQEDVLLEVTTSRTPSAFCRPARCPSDSGFLIPTAVSRIIARSLESSHTALAIADRTTGFFPLKIGLPELRGCGLEGVGKIIAKEIGRICLSMSFVKSGVSPRWSHLPSIISMTRAISRPLARLCESPLLQDDPLVLKLSGASQFTYDRGYLALDRRISVHLCRLTLALIHNPLSALFTDVVVVFSDEPAGHLSRVVVRSIHAALHLAVISGEFNESIARKVARQQIPSYLRRESDEAGKLNALYRLCFHLIDWCQTNHFTCFMGELRKLTNATRIIMVDIPSTEALRLARHLQSLRIELLKSNSPITCTSLPIAHWITRPEATPLRDPLSHPSWHLPWDHQAYTLFSVARLRGRIHGGISSAGYSYLPVSALFKDRVCLLVGCGHGGGGAVMILAGASKVLGLDLGADMSSAYQLDFPDYPPGLTHLKDRYKFDRIYGGPLADGDIHHPETWNLVRKSCSAGSLCVVDIPLPTRQSVLQLLTSLCSLWATVEALIRWIGTVDQTRDLVATLVGCATSVRVYHVFSDGVYTECWIHCILPTTTSSLNSSYSPVEIIFPSNITPGPEPALGGGEMVLRDLCFGEYSTLVQDETVSLIGVTAAMIADSVGPLEHRFSYQQWSTLLTALVCQFVINCGDPVGYLIQFLTRDVLHLRAFSFTTIVAMDRSRRRILSRVLPRLL